MIYCGYDVLNMNDDFYFIYSDENDILCTDLGNKNICVDNLYHSINNEIYNCATNKKLNKMDILSFEIVHAYKSIKINSYEEGAVVYLNLNYGSRNENINGILGVLKDGMIYTECTPPISSDLVNYFLFDCISIREQMKINEVQNRICSKINKINYFKNCIDVYKRPLFTDDYVLYYDGVLSLGRLTCLGEVITPYGYSSVGTYKNSYYKINFKFDINDKIIWYGAIYEESFDKKMVDVLGSQLCIGDFVIINFNSKNISYGLVISSTQCILLSGKKTKCSSVCKIASLNNVSNLLSDELIIYNKLKKLYDKEVAFILKNSVNTTKKELGQVYCSNKGSKYYIYLGKYLCQFYIKMNYYKYINDYDNNIVDLYLIIDLNKQYQVDFYNSLLSNCALEKDFMHFCGLISNKYISQDIIQIGLGHFDANIGKGKMSNKLGILNIPSFMKQIKITSDKCDAIYTYKGI